MKFLIFINPKRTFGDKEVLETFFKINGEFHLYDALNIIDFLEELLNPKSQSDYFKFLTKLLERQMNLLGKMNFKELESFLLAINCIKMQKIGLSRAFNHRGQKEEEEELNDLFSMSLQSEYISKIYSFYPGLLKQSMDVKDFKDLHEKIEIRFSNQIEICNHDFRKNFFEFIKNNLG